MIFDEVRLLVHLLTHFPFQNLQQSKQGISNTDLAFIVWDPGHQNLR